MTESRKQKVRPCLLIILDGFGVNPNTQWNAVAQAKTPTLTKLLKNYPNTTLDASESQVGLPKGFMGNSEVGHLNIGAGRIVFQDFSLISHAIETETFFENGAIGRLFDDLKANPKNPTLHLMGLVSDGGVHSHLSHLFALIQFAERKSFSNISIHAFTDGRDSSPTSGIGFLKQLSEFCTDAGRGKISTVTGRFYAMDRDKRWDRTEKAYQAIVSAQSEYRFTDPVEFVREQYEQKITDEFLPPACARGYSGIKGGDGALFFNFRPDRARQLARALTQASPFTEFKRTKAPLFCDFVGLTRYDDTLPILAAFEKPKVEKTLGEIVSSHGWSQLRIAETEKYAHVTYFFNGGEEKAFPGESRVLIASDREILTYDLRPEMRAHEITDRMLEELEKHSYSFVVVNFANPDMVGHTGNIPAAIRAVETVDECLKKIIKWVEQNSAFALITSDHGNCELMRDAEGLPLTSHTLLPVPFLLVDPERPGLTLRSGGRLCDIAPTLLQLWNIPQPAQMTGKSLLA